MSASKENSFLPICSVSSALTRSTAGATTRDKPGPAAKGAFYMEGNKEKEEVVQCESQQQSSPPCVVEDFFWIGNSIVAFSKWRLGYMGKLSQIHWVELDWLDKDNLQLHIHTCVHTQHLQIMSR